MDEDLLEAAARVLAREGAARFTTNRVAEAAGVSVGSLYQYYPSKEALVAAVIERHNQEIMTGVYAAVVEVEAQPLEQAARTLIAAAVEAHRVNPKLHRVLAEQTPRTGALANVDTFNGEAYGLFRAYLERHRDEVRVVDLDLAAFVCVTSIEALTHTAVIHRADILSDAAVGTLVDEATRLVVRYLQ